jgi:hypothetical protein
MADKQIQGINVYRERRFSTRSVRKMENGHQQSQNASSPKTSPEYISGSKETSVERKVGIEPNLITLLIINEVMRLLFLCSLFSTEVIRQSRKFGRGF